MNSIDKYADELLKELSSLSCDINEEEIRAHSVISVKHGSYNCMYCLDMNREWLDAWHAEFDRIMQAIAATLGRPTFNANLEQALSFMRIWISDDAHLGESELSEAFEKAEGLRKLQAIEDAIAATLGSGECEDIGSAAIFKCSECGWYSPVFTFGKDMPQFCPQCGKAVKR